MHRCTVVLSLLLVVCTAPSSSQSFDRFIARARSLPASDRGALVDSFMTAVPSFPFIESDSIAHFIYRGSASSVTVPGDANGWNPNASSMENLQGTDFWYRTDRFEPDARLDYKFVLGGGIWILDQLNPHTVSGGFGPNSELRMPRYMPHPEIEYYPDIPHGSMWDTTLSSATLGNSRRVRIYTPPSYSTSTDSFPVILFHDGLEYISLAWANNVLDYLIVHRGIKPVIAVFVPPVNRTPEYMGNQVAAFSRFIVDSVMGFVDRRYRTRRAPLDRAVMGASAGGNISLYLAYNYPEEFGNAAAQSSYVDPSLAGQYRNDPRLGLHVYLDIGTYDQAILIPMVRSFHSLVLSAGYSVQYGEYHEGHSWGNWRTRIGDALRMFIPGPASAVPRDERSHPGFELNQNYPNPANPGTTFRFSLSKPGEVSLKVFDSLGREVATLARGYEAAGTHVVSFDGSWLPAGVYYCRLQSGEGMLTRRLVLLK